MTNRYIAREQYNRKIERKPYPELVEFITALTIAQRQEKLTEETIGNCMKEIHYNAYKVKVV